MAKSFVKDSDGKLQVTETVSQSVKYSLAELQRERAAAEATVVAAEARVVELDALISECSKAGVSK